MRSLARRRGSMVQLSSVRARLISYYSLSVALLIGVSVYAIFQMIAPDRLTESLDSKWVAGTRILGEIADLITEVRLDEARLALAGNQARANGALVSAEQHVNAIVKERAAYAALDKTEEEQNLLEIFDWDWRSWSTEHDAWIALPHDERLAASPVFQLRADALYRIADEAIDALITVNSAGADAAGARADRIVDMSSALFAVIVAFALVLASWVIWVIHAGISRPLTSITKALS